MFKLNRFLSGENLYFDEYDFEECPEDICGWVENGATLLEGDSLI
jgi:hypothetical protein